MAVHQYIGARYVPGFKGTYSATTVYEALDVVDDGLGTSYIAKIPVPAGTPLTDTNYWMVYGSSNGAIINLQNRMTAVENDITNNIEPAIEALERNILVIGNSYAQRGCCNDLKNCFKNAYQYVEGGVGFIAYTGHPNTFETLLDTAIADTSFDNDTITDIIFTSAMGDTRASYHEGSNFNSALVTALSAIQTKIAANFTNVKRSVITLAETRAISYFADNRYSDLFIVHRAFKNYAPRYGFDYVGWCGWTIMFQSSLIDSDNYHPTTAGAAIISAWLRNAYFGKAEYRTIYALNGSVPSAYTTGATCPTVMFMTPDLVSLEIRRIDTTAGASISIAVGTSLLDFDAIAVPAPAPMNDTNIFTPIMDIIPASSTFGDIVDFMKFTLTGDAHGLLALNKQSGTKASTAASAQVSPTNIENLCYVP